MTQLAFAGVRVEFGATRLLDDVTFTVSRGERWGVIGRNGAGKTTLFRLATGELQPTAGTVARATGLRISLMDQQREFAGAGTVWEAAAGPYRSLLDLERSLAEQATALSEAGDQVTDQALARYGRDLERFQREDGYSVAARIDAVLHGLGFDPDQARRRPLDGLSGGERGRLGLVRQLVAPADLLLLDEPTNHLDLETTRWLENHLRQLDATVMVVSHDRAFLQAVVDHVLHLEAGTALAYTGDYEAFIRQRTERRLAQQRAFAKQSRVLAAEEDYIRRNIAGQNSAQAKGRRRRLMRVSRLSPPPGEEGAMALRLAADERGGDQVLVARDVRLEVEGRTLLRDFSARVGRGDVVGLVGPNGAGKSTLLRAIVGDRTPDAGEIRVPDSVRIAYYRQDLAQVPQDRTLYEIIADLRPSWGRGPIQGHLGRFGFSGDSVQRRAGSLSGGETARVALAMMMLSGANFLIFDEPTNHLDVESIEALEDAIEEFDGTVLLVSHDRALLRALTTRMWVLHGERITDFDGGFAEWEAASVEREHAAAVGAAEEEALRRVRERKVTRPHQDPRKARRRSDAAHKTARREDERKTARGTEDGPRKLHSRRRSAERAVAEAELRVSERERVVEELRRRLEDPALYLAPDAATQAHRLGAELEEARASLEAAFAEWEAATRNMEDID